MKRSVPLYLSLWVAVSLMLSAMGSPAPARVVTTIYSTNFNSGFSGWTTSGSVVSVFSPAIVANSVSLRGTSSITRTVSTVGYTGISVTWNMAASSLESNDRCYAEYSNNGSTWTAIGTLNDGQDNSTFFSGTTSNIVGADQNASFRVRYRGNGFTTGDYCYAEDITITGTASGGATNTSTPTITATPSGPTNTPTRTPTITPTSTGPTITPNPCPATSVATPTPSGSAPNAVPGDPLTGSGVGTRSLLTCVDLMSGSSTAIVNDSAFAMPSYAAPASYTFEGTLQLTNEATSGGFSEVRDDYSYTNATDSTRKHLPEFDFQFVQNGSHLIPVKQGLTLTTHANWEYILGPGRVWNEAADNGWSRASFPFALVQRNANCTHNGVMTFLFNSTGISKVRYQITQETCTYFKYNMWGQLSATYIPAAVSNALTLKNNHATEIGNRIPTKPISALTTDYPSSGINVSTFGSGITAAHLTTYGLYYNGVNYIGGCTTRSGGSYAYCEQMRLPSYSTAKSAFAGIALMRLGQMNGTGVYNLKIKDYVSEYTQGGDWATVTFNHTIDMATGNYESSGYEVDEGDTGVGAIMEGFFLAEPYTNKVSYAFDYPDTATAPGALWVYHSTDTFLVTRAMSQYHGSDIFNLVRDSVYVPLKLNAGALTTVRTDRSATGIPFGGYGLFWTQDDIAKVARLLNNDHGVINGTQVLEPSMLDDSMQDDASDRGEDTTGTTVFKYNNGFWAKQFTTSDGFTCSFYAPFMSGYGGITVVMMPNGATYYYFSDNTEYSWSSSVIEANKLSPHCP